MLYWVPSPNVILCWKCALWPCLGCTRGLRVHSIIVFFFTRVDVSERERETNIKSIKQCWRNGWNLPTKLHCGIEVGKKLLNFATWRVNVLSFKLFFMKIKTVNKLYRDLSTSYKSKIFKTDQLVFRYVVTCKLRKSTPTIRNCFLSATIRYWFLTNRTQYPQYLLGPRNSYNAQSSV